MSLSSNEVIHDSDGIKVELHWSHIPEMSHYIYIWIEKTGGDPVSILVDWPPGHDLSKSDVNVCEEQRKI